VYVCVCMWVCGFVGTERHEKSHTHIQSLMERDKRGDNREMREKDNRDRDMYVCVLLFISSLFASLFVSVCVCVCHFFSHLSLRLCVCTDHHLSLSSIGIPVTQVTQKWEILLLFVVVCYCCCCCLFVVAVRKLTMMSVCRSKGPVIRRLWHFIRLQISDRSL